MANGDDFNYYYPQPFPDDEDGVIIPKLGPSHIGPLFSGNSVPTFIYVDGGPTGGILQVWIDLNFNGTFDHPTEQVIPNTSIPPGALGGNPIKAIPIQIPSLPYTCQTYARFRLSPNGNLSPFGPCEGGEVEDYLVDLLWDQSLPVELRDLKAEFLRNSVIISWKTESESENRGFEIYRSNSENGDYQLISSYVTSIDLKGLGNSTLGKEYTYIDELVIPKGKVFYKIADISSSNEKEFHGPVVINFKDYSQEITPDKIGLLPNYPNPFNPSTTIKYQISEIGFVDLAIYDIKGNLVKTLVSRKMVSGTYTQKWDATNMNGIQLPSGIYIVRLISNNVSITQRILLMR